MLFRKELSDKIKKTMITIVGLWHFNGKSKKHCEFGTMFKETVNGDIRYMDTVEVHNIKMTWMCDTV